MYFCWLFLILLNMRVKLSFCHNVHPSIVWEYSAVTSWQWTENETDLILCSKSGMVPRGSECYRL